MLLVRNFVYNNVDRNVLVEDTDMSGDVFGYDLSLFSEEERETLIKASEILNNNKNFYRHYKGEKIRSCKIIQSDEEDDSAKNLTKKEKNVIINI
jgi:hypothetical protein